MSLPATDNFNRADGGVGANWTALQNSGAVASGHEVASNQVRGAASGFCYSRWNADVFNADHYSQAVGVNIATGFYLGPMVRMPASGAVEGYWWMVNAGGTGTLYRVDGGLFTSVQASVPLPADASVVKLTATGTGLALYDDGVQVGTTATDATYASGSAGICNLRDVPIALMDDWEGGNMAAAVRRWILGAH
jgi:hypothetical protein